MQTTSISLCYDYKSKNQIDEYTHKFNTLFNGRINYRLIQECVQSISLNDPAHDLSHVYHVCKNAIDIIEHYRDIRKMTLQQELIVYLGCLMHDLGCRYDRDNHHVIGYGLVYQYIYKYCPHDFHKDEIAEMATCVLEHRSSNKNLPSTFLSEIVSVADSGLPNIDIYIKRAVKFRCFNPKYVNHTCDEIVSEVYEHMLDKFGSNGYHWKSYSEVGLTFYEKEWVIFKRILNNEETLKQRIKPVVLKLMTKPFKDRSKHV